MRKSNGEKKRRRGVGRASLDGLEEQVSDIGHEGGAVFEVGKATDKDREDERAGSVDDGGVVVNLGDFAGFVGDFGARRKAGGNPFIEFLALEDGEHLLRSVRAGGGVVGDGGEEYLEGAGGGGVVEALLEGFGVFDAAKNVHAVGVQGVDGGTDVCDPEFFDDEVGGEITADGDHEFAELGEGARLALGFVKVGFGVVCGIEFVGGAIDDGVELVVDGERVGEFELAGLNLAVEFDHNGHFHGAGGVEGVIGVVEPFGFAIESAEGDADVGMGVGDALLDLLFGGGEVGGLGGRGCRYECDDGEKEDKLPQG